ncbi:MAG TPA: hypothetical protein VMH61_04285 [Candidatus Acidoferrales bacterium]|nr:hypothetical protein [Candidatus Acidoferrales bacterium]
MLVADAQRATRTAYRGGLAGQLVSAAVWAASAACGTWGSHTLAMIVLVFGGFFIFPLTVLSLRLGGVRAPAGPRNPLDSLAIQVAFTVPLALPVVLTLAHFAPGLFFPAVLLIVGAHYLPFVFLYGMPQWFGLGGAMLAGGYVLGWVRPMGFAAGGWFGAAVLAVFAFVGWRTVVAEERRSAS